MQKEIILNKQTDLTVNVVANTVESLRKTVETTSTVRVYENGFIGVAGQIGKANLAELEKTAIANLENKLPYPEQLPSGNVRHVDAVKNIINPDNFVAVCKKLLARMSAEEPNFLFNNKIKYIENECSYNNSKGCDMSYKGNEMIIELTIKDKASANLMDTYIGVELADYDEDKIIADLHVNCNKMRVPCDIEKGKYKVIADGQFFGQAISNMVGESYAAGASLFKDKLGEKIFSDKLCLQFNRSPENLGIAFFDDEGETAENDLSYLVKDGVFKAVLANKKTADDYNLPRVPTSSASYDGIPGAGMSGFEFGDSGKSIAELVGKDKAIFVVIASGGDITSSGDYATPVQAAFLYEDGKLTGKLPPLNVYGNVNDYFGKDYIGASRDGIFSVKYQQFVVAEMNVEKIN